jgi:hypothetical protein
VRRPRSIIFYAWALAAAQSALVAGVITVVLVGGAQQRADLSDLHRAQAAQLANLAMVDEFLAAQRAVRAYRATGDRGLHGAYRTAKTRFFASLTRLANLAGTDTASLVAGQARLAEESFGAAGQALAVAPGSVRAARLYTRASALSGRYFAQDGVLRARLP